MDFQELVDCMASMSCIISVERVGDGYGEIRIVAGNRAYVDSIEKPSDGIQMLKTEFVPNSKYTDYLTQDLNFETFCFLSAVKKRSLHSYVNPDRLPAWFDLTFMPLDLDDDKLSYCIYSMEITLQPDSKRISSISEDLASEVLETAIKLSTATDFKSVMGDIIEDIRQLCDAEQCCILLADDFKRECSVLCESFAEGSQLAPMETLLSDRSFEIARSWDKAIAGSNCFIVASDHDKEIAKERVPEWYAEFITTGVDNILLFPLKSIDKTIGYIWAVNFDSSNTLTIKETLEVTSYVLAAQVGNYLMLDQLRLLSSHDMLTGVQSSNELNLVIEKTIADARDEPIGIAIADLNGLKAVNDEQGHGAGDALLKDAARALLDVFEPSQVFRAGGDEFAAVIPGATEAEMAEKAAQLRAAAGKYDKLSFAVGFCVEAKSADVRKAMRAADKDMYDDKRAYYARTCHDRRR